MIVDVEASRAVAKPKLQPHGPCWNATDQLELANLTALR